MSVRCRIFLLSAGLIMTWGITATGYGQKLPGDAETGKEAASSTCTICDDPADDGVVNWCNPATCVAGAAPHAGIPGTAGYCPALYYRIRKEDYSKCDAVTVTKTGASSFCADGNRVYMGNDVGCAYSILAEQPNTAGGQIKERWYSGGGLAKVGYPTSMRYRVPGFSDRWYQFFEFGIIMNNYDGSDAFYVGEDNDAGQALKAGYKEAIQNNVLYSLFPDSNMRSSGNSRYVTLYTYINDVETLGGLFAQSDSAHLVIGAYYDTYANYDAKVTNPDQFLGFLGWPTSDVTYEERRRDYARQTFEGGMMHGITPTISDSYPQAFIYADLGTGMAPNAACDPSLSQTDCNNTTGCEYRESTCLGIDIATCSAIPDTFLCKTYTNSTDCGNGLGCSWTGSECVNAYGGALGVRMDWAGLDHTVCDDSAYENSTGYYTMSCAVGSVPYKIIWSPETECAHLMTGGTSNKAKIKSRYEASFTARANNTSYSLGDIRTNQGNVYMAMQAGISGAVSSIPNGSNPAVLETDGGVKWRFLATGSTYADVLGPPTSEALGIGTSSDHWVQYFVRGALVYKDGDSHAYMIGDGTPTGVDLKNRWQIDARADLVVANDLFPTRDTAVTRCGNLVLPTGTTSSPTAYFASDLGAYFLGKDALGIYEDYDETIANPDYACGKLGKPTSDQSTFSTWEYVTFEGGVLSDFYGGWALYDSYPLPEEYGEQAGSHKRPYCLASSYYGLAIHMKAVEMGLAPYSFLFPYTDVYPIDATTFVGGYRYSPETGKVVIYHKSNHGEQEPVQCAFVLSGKIATKWGSFTNVTRQVYGYPTSDSIPIYDDSNNLAGTIAFLQNGVIIHKQGDTNAYVLGAARFAQHMQGRALKKLYVKKYFEGVVDSEGYYLDADTTEGSSHSGWVATFEGLAGDPEGRRFAVKGVTCETHNYASCIADPSCEWGPVLGSYGCINKAYEVKGYINDRYESWNYIGELQVWLHYEQGAIGYPVSDQMCGNDDCTWVYQNFEGRGIEAQGSSTNVTSSAIFVCDQCDETNYCETSCHTAAYGTQSNCGEAGSCMACNPGNCPVFPTGKGGGCKRLCNSGTTQQPNLITCGDYHASQNNDKDSDGIDDDFEKDIARHFAPLMWVNDQKNLKQYYGMEYSGAYCPDANADCAQPYKVRAYDGVGAGIDCNQEPYQCLEITYGVLWNYDFGDMGFESHAGDSEHYAVLVARKDPRTDGEPKFPETSWASATNDSTIDEWYRVKEFFSAHRCAGRAESSAVLWTEFFDYSDRRERNEKLYVADNKHALYAFKKSAQFGTINPYTCAGGGFFGSDHCSANLSYSVFGGWSDRNVGEKYCHVNNDHHVLRPGHGRPSRAGPGLYDVWSYEKFGHASPTEHFLRPDNIKWNKNSWQCNF